MLNGPFYRRGLSTLELVLALPLLLMVMALMVNFGTAACWKIRTLVMARQTLWSSRSGRSGVADLQPAWWPTPDGTTASQVSQVPAFDDPRLNQPVARGPLPAETSVHADLLDPTRELRTGLATLKRLYPMLGKMGSYRLSTQSVLVDGKWTYSEMGLWSNEERRIPAIYALAKAPHELVEAYVKAVVALLKNPWRGALRPLDQDEEFIDYGAFLGWDSGPPDFHPRLNSFCSLDRDLADEHVLDLIDHIQGKVDRDKEGNVVRRIPDVAEAMAQAFLDLYEQVIREAQDPAGHDPPLPPGTTAALQAKIDILHAFLQALTSN